MRLFSKDLWRDLMGLSGIHPLKKEFEHANRYLSRTLGLTKSTLKLVDFETSQLRYTEHI